jgi:hypothetical protein
MHFSGLHFFPDTNSPPSHKLHVANNARGIIKSVSPCISNLLHLVFPATRSETSLLIEHQSSSLTWLVLYPSGLLRTGLTIHNARLVYPVKP